jgi:flavin-dependent dehydrogenase
MGRDRVVAAGTDVLVVGAGLAGLHTATLLARRGHDVTLVDRRRRLDASIRTTGIFVRRTLDDFDLPPDCLGPAIRQVALYPPSLGHPVLLRSDRDEFRVGDMGRLYRTAGDRAGHAGVRLWLGARYLGREEGRYVVRRSEGGTVHLRARFVVGADGARSRVARDLGLDRNRHLLIGGEEVRPATDRGTVPAFHCVLDPLLAPGYLAWVVDDGQHVHVGTAGYPGRFPDGLPGAMRRLRASAPGLPGRPGPDAVERRGGLIPVGGVLRRISCRDGLLVGDAAGAVSPLTAGGLDPCLRLSEHAATVLDEALSSGDADVLRQFDGAALRRLFRGRVSMRRAMSRLRSPSAVEAAFTLLRTPPGRAAARRILFADSSFPLPRPVEAGLPPG